MRQKRWVPVILFALIIVLCGTILLTIPPSGEQPPAVAATLETETVNNSTPFLFVSGIAVLTVGAISLNRQRKRRRATPKPNSSAFTSGTPEKIKLNWDAWSSPILSILSFVLFLVLMFIFWPSLWKWLIIANQKIFWLLVAAVIVAAVAAKYKKIWWLVAIMGLVLFSCDWATCPNPRDWRLSAEEAEKAAAQRKTAPAADARGTATSRVRQRKVVAPLGNFSEMVSIPAHNDFRILPMGKIMVRTASNKKWEDWPGNNHNIGRNLRLHDAMFQFMSLEKDKEVEVIVEWEPK